MFYFKKSVVTVFSFTRTYLKSVCVYIYIDRYLYIYLRTYLVHTAVLSQISKKGFFLLSEKHPWKLQGVLFNEFIDF